MKRETHTQKKHLNVLTLYRSAKLASYPEILQLTCCSFCYGRVLLFKDQKTSYSPAKVITWNFKDTCHSIAWYRGFYLSYLNEINYSMFKFIPIAREKSLLPTKTKFSLATLGLIIYRVRRLCIWSDNWNWVNQLKNQKFNDIHGWKFIQW